MESNDNPLGAFAKAVAFAADKHRNQRRKDAEASPYINHPIALANVLANEGNVTDVAVLCAAVLHDTIEDTETTSEELTATFGSQITDHRPGRDRRQVVGKACAQAAPD
jgi:guanosine-3',5'-bis(diphosphate) 3'-pyrophosphohydrolase